MFESIDKLVSASKGEGVTRTNRILTWPNAITISRLLLIPPVVVLLSGDGTEGWGIALLVVVMSTDWLDGFVARKTQSVSELGRLLDPLSDRLVIGAALVTFVVQDAFPLWAAALIIVRDVVLLLVGMFALSLRRHTIEVRWLGKVATFDLMVGVPLIAWGGFGLRLAAATLAVGWTCFAIGAVLYYVTAGQYLRDLSRVLRAPLGRPS
jgi:cardiolipin synthase